MGIHPADTRDSLLRGTFHGYSLSVLLWGVSKPGSYWTRALYPSGLYCCSPRSLTFSAGEADKMRTLNYILYRLYVYESGTFGNRPAPTSMPEDEVQILSLLNISSLILVTNSLEYKI